MVARKEEKRTQGEKAEEKRGKAAARHKAAASHHADQPEEENEPDSKLKMARGDTLHAEITRSISGKLEHLIGTL